MFQRIDGILVYVVDFDTMPELPITGLTEEEASYKNFTRMLSWPPFGSLAETSQTGMTYAKALTHAIETGVITEPGKYGIHLKPGKLEYEIYTINEPVEEEGA